MNNIKKYDEFVNEGIKSFISKTFKPGEIDHIIENIIKDIKKYFNISDLTAEQNDTMYNTYTYKTSKGDIIKINPYNFIYLNNENVTQFVNVNYTKELYDFLDDKYENINIEIEKEKKKNKLSDIDKNYWSKYDPNHNN